MSEAARDISQAEKDLKAGRTTSIRDIKRQREAQRRQERPARTDRPDHEERRER